MGIALLKGSSGVNIHIQNTTFRRNRANWGGGLCIYVQQQTYNNTVLIENSTFAENHARVGGGGIQVRFGEVTRSSDNYTFILFQRSIIKENLANYGGGVSINALFVTHITKPGEVIQFINCTWYNNRGQYSPAVDLSLYRFQQSNQGFLPVPLFRDIFIQKNQILLSRKKVYNRVIQGVFIVTRFTVYFQGFLHFSDNWNSALYLTSGRAIFDVNSTVLFHSNRAIKGGAISVHGFSAMIVNDHSHFQFINNSAARVGGGILYASTDQREYYAGRTCFLDYGGNMADVTKRDITFTFRGNKAPLGGVSIYAASLFSCYFAYIGGRNYWKHNEKNITSLFDRIGTFHFDNSRLSLATGAKRVEFDGKSSGPIEAVPGKELSLPLAMKDEFENVMNSEYALRVEDNERIHLFNYFAVNNKTRLYGPSNQNGTLVLSTPRPLYNIDYHVQVKLLPCPPGFFHDELIDGCQCSADDSLHSYPAITKCDYSDFRAYVKHGYWVGYYPSGIQHPNNLYTVFYTLSHVNFNTDLQLLPTNGKNLSDFICGSSREGILCGTCKQGYSAYFHSKEIICGDNRYCKFGILFFLLSEIIPTAIFFIVVIILGISFSSGSLNGFVLFSQVIDVFSQDFVKSQMYSDKTSTVINVLQSGHRLIYGVFNINFFSAFPFCLWKGASVMDVLAFKYITTVFAFTLIALIVVMMNCSMKQCTRVNKMKRKDSSVTHGISTFLIICYGQYTRVSFFILNKTFLQGKPGIRSVSVTYYGGLPYFGRIHLLYAIPAILFTIVLVIFPPICLLMYPLVLHVLGVFGLSEHPVVNKVLQLLHINHLMPLFDSFQSCYKDKMRFFAGLFFLYRIAAFLAFIYSNTIPPVFLAVLILGIHSVLQPYKSWKYNVIDALLFLDIAIVSSIAVMIKISLIEESSRNAHIVLQFVQLVFIYLPMFAFPVIMLTQKLSSKCKTTKSTEEPTIIMLRDLDSDQQRFRESTTLPETAHNLAEPLLSY